MSKGNNVIDNVNGIQGNNYNVNDNDRYDKGKSIEIIADRLLEKLGAQPASRPFMCKVAYRLPEATIWSNVEQALKGRNPVGLFIYLCKRDGV